MTSFETPALFIVEDNFMYSYVLENKLRDKEHFKITTFASGEEGVQLMGNNPAAVILDDYLVGAMNGFNTFKKIQEKKPGIPIIILSGQYNVQVAAGILKAGAFDYIEKKEGVETMVKLRRSVLKAISKN